MDVSIEELVSRVRMVDGEAPLSPRALQKVVAAVLAAVEAREDHRDRVRAERRVTGGVSQELEED